MHTYSLSLAHPWANEHKFRAYNRLINKFPEAIFKQLHFVPLSNKTIVDLFGCTALLLRSEDFSRSHSLTPAFLLSCSRFLSGFRSSTLFNSLPPSNSHSHPFAFCLDLLLCFNLPNRCKQIFEKNVTRVALKREHKMCYCILPIKEAAVSVVRREYTGGIFLFLSILKQ